ncbi:MAG: phosphopentomutase [Oligoflexales bacterium]|nr:phosphopentomutase [Oligoflexales bacterium]
MGSFKYNRVLLIVLDSLGVGAAHDAERFGDGGTHTLGHIAKYCAENKKEFSLPNLSALGLGRLVPAFGLDATAPLKGAFGKMQELSPGKDTSTGHWEIAGSPLDFEFPLFPQGFPESLMQQWLSENKLASFLCNKPASGTEVIAQYGAEHLRTGYPIVYTSGDSVFQVACHEQSFGLERLYDICKSARRLLDPLGVGRVIARPFIGDEKSGFSRTENRRDFSMPPPYPNMLDCLLEQKRFVAGVGKIEDIFAHRGLSIVNHTGRNETSLLATSELLGTTKGQSGLIFTNLIDFDQLHGHRRNPETYAQALMDFDAYLPEITKAMADDDLLILTADHGNDPTFRGTDHTREDVPLLIYAKNSKFHCVELGTLSGFHTVARLTLDALGIGENTLYKIKDLATAPVVFSKVSL